MSAAQYHEKGRYLKYYVKNNKLKSTKEVLRLIYNRLQNDPMFKKLGDKKILFVQCWIEGQKYAFHRNVLISKTMSFETYWSMIEEDIENHYDNSVYWIDKIPSFEIMVWNIYLPSNSKIKVNKSTSKVSGFHTLTSGFYTLTAGFPSSSTARGFHSLTSSFSNSHLGRGFHSLANKVNSLVWGFQPKTFTYKPKCGVNLMEVVVPTPLFYSLPKSSHPFGWIRCRSDMVIKPLKKSSMTRSP